MLVGVLGLALWRFLAPAAAVAPCDFSEGPCSVAWGEATLEVSADPTPLHPDEPTRFTLRPGPGAPPLPPSASMELEMPGMEMGDHRATLTRSTDRDSLSGVAALPVCPLGGTLWKATVRFEGAPTAELTFHLVP